MRRTLMILSLLSVSIISIGCGERATTVTNASTNSSSNITGANTSGAGATGTGPQTQGIGGNTNDGGAVSGNTYTVPPGFNKNGDRGSASSVGNTSP